MGRSGVRTLLLSLVLIAALIGGYRMFDREADLQVGMTARPCNEAGQPVTGSARDDWAALCLYQADNARILAAGKPPRVVMIGDSITAYWPEHGKGIVHRGIGGQTSQQVLLRFGQDVAALKPEQVHILVGTNDIAGNTGPNSAEMYKANIRAMVDMARANGIEPVLALLPPVRYFDWKPDISPDPWLGQINAWLKDYAGKKGLALADYHAVLIAADGSFDQSLFVDGVHPNEAGYARMDAVFAEATGKAAARD